MNCPTRVDPEALPNGWNQNPDTYATQTNSDTNATANRLRLRDHRIDPRAASQADGINPDQELGVPPKKEIAMGYSERDVDSAQDYDAGWDGNSRHNAKRPGQKVARQSRRAFNAVEETAKGAWRVLRKYAKFVGPGWMISVAYIDPGMCQILLFFDHRALC